MTKDLNTLYLDKNNLNTELSTLTTEFERAKKELNAKIKNVDKYIKNYEVMDAKSADGAQYVSDIWGKAKYVGIVARYLLAEIRDGHLPEIIEEHENVSYWYNSGFKSGHARRMRNGYGEDYASCYAKIELDMETVDSASTLALISYLNTVIKQTETYSKSLPTGTILSIKRHEYGDRYTKKYFRVLNKKNYLLENLDIGDPTPDLNDWDLAHGRFEVELRGDEYVGHKENNYYSFGFRMPEDAVHLVAGRFDYVFEKISNKKEKVAK